MPERGHFFHRHRVRTDAESGRERRRFADGTFIETIALRQRELAETAADLLQLELRLIAVLGGCDHTHADVDAIEEPVELIHGARELVFFIVRAHAHALFVILLTVLTHVAREHRNVMLGPDEPCAEAAHEHVDRKHRKCAPAGAQVGLGEELRVGTPVLRNPAREQRQKLERALPIALTERLQRDLNVPAHPRDGVADESRRDARDGIHRLSRDEIDRLRMAADGEEFALGEIEILIENDLPCCRLEQIHRCRLDFAVRVLSIQLAFDQRSSLS